MMRAFGGSRVRYVPQMESAECGAACLAMVLDHFGAAIPLAELRNACAVTRDGASALQILHAARQHGLEGRALKLEVAQLAALPVPAMLHWGFNHFVVLEYASSRGARIVDPASGRRWVKSSELDRAFTGVAIYFARAAGFQRVPRPSGSLRWYVAVLRQCRGGVALVLAVTALLELMSSMFPAANQFLIDQVITERREQWLVPLLLAIGGASLIQTTFEVLRGRTVAALAYAIDLVLASSLVDHLLRLPITFFLQRSAGDLMQRVAAIEQLRQLSTRVATGGFDVLLIASYAPLLLLCDVRLGLVAIAMCCVRVALLTVLAERTRQYAAAEIALRGPETSALVEGLTAPEMIKAFHAEALMLERYTQRLFERTKATYALQTVSSTAHRAASLVDVAIGVVVIWMGGNAVIDERMTLGTLICTLTLCGLLQAAFSSFAEVLTSLVYAGSVVTRIDDVMHSQKECAGHEPVGVLRGEITLTGLGYRHGANSDWVFRDLHARVEPGEKIAIVGRSGSGKTTLSRVLAGLLEPTTGSVLLDGQDLRRLDLAQVRAQLGVVLQEPFMFDDTIRSNLSLYRPEASLLELEQAASIACIANEIAMLPGGYNTQLGAAGHRFSRGQMQRLALARALVARPRILVLDEATSSLDLETEARLHHNLSTVHCTRIIIAHRLATVLDADRIFVLEDGQFVQQGSYAELKVQPGTFQRMVHSLA